MKTKTPNMHTRTVIVLQQEVARMAAAAERVRLVTEALALQSGLRSMRPEEVED